MKAILLKLHKIMQSVERIEKDKVNDFHKYAYASEQAIKETLHPLLVANGVLFSLDLLDSTVTGSLTHCKFKYHFWDIESGEKLTGDFQGFGEDKNDKGIYKAITGATKYILTTTFLIPTGDDPEGDGGEGKASKGRGATKPAAPSTSTKPVSKGAVPPCPICQGAMWDNRVGKRNPKSPDFKCKDKKCEGVVWHEHREKPAAKAPVADPETGEIKEPSAAPTAPSTERIAKMQNLWAQYFFMAGTPLAKEDAIKKQTYLKAFKKSSSADLTAMEIDRVIQILEVKLEELEKEEPAQPPKK